MGTERTNYLAQMLATLPEERATDAQRLIDLINELSECYTAELMHQDDVE